MEENKMTKLQDSDHGVIWNVLFGEAFRKDFAKASENFFDLKTENAKLTEIYKITIQELRTENELLKSLLIELGHPVESNFQSNEISKERIFYIANTSIMDLIETFRLTIRKLQIDNEWLRSQLQLMANKDG